MERWVKAGVIGTFLCVVLQFWGNYRLEHPSQALQTENSAWPMTKHTLLLAVHYASPIVAGILLFASVWIAFRKGRQRPPNETDAERIARERLYEFFRLCGRDLYRDASNFANALQSKFASGEGLRACLGGIHRVYTQHDFRARFTTLTALIPPHPDASGAGPLDDLETAFWLFIQSYKDWALWTEKAALLAPIDIHSDNSYLEWKRSEVEFFQRLKETTATAGLHWLDQQTRGLNTSRSTNI